jgi:hypothetical protein
MVAMAFSSDDVGTFEAAVADRPEALCFERSGVARDREKWFERFGAPVASGADVWLRRRPRGWAEATMELGVWLGEV